MLSRTPVHILENGLNVNGESLLLVQHSFVSLHLYREYLTDEIHNTDLTPNKVMNVLIIWITLRFEDIQ